MIIIYFWSDLSVRPLPKYLNIWNFLFHFLFMLITIISKIYLILSRCWSWTSESFRKPADIMGHVFLCFRLWKKKWVFNVVIKTKECYLLEANWDFLNLMKSINKSGGNKEINVKICASLAEKGFLHNI